MERGYTILAIGTIKIFAMAGENEKVVEVCNGLLDELEAEAAQHTLAGGLACTCAKVRFYPDENVFDEACPIHGTQAAKA